MQNKKFIRQHNRAWDSAIEVTIRCYKSRGWTDIEYTIKDGENNRKVITYYGIPGVLKKSDKAQSIIDARKGLGLTQKQLGEILALSRGAICNYERGLIIGDKNYAELLYRINKLYTKKESIALPLGTNIAL